MPRAQRVVQEEVHHVILGEQLRDGRQFIRADLVAGGVDLLLPLRLPELIGPTQGVTGGEAVGGTPSEES